MSICILIILIVNEMKTNGHSKDNLLKLLTWLSPSFPVGAYSYSHGIEFAVEENLVNDAKTLREWVEGILYYGAGQKDGIVFSETWKTINKADENRLLYVIEIANAFQPTTEMALESRAQGAAFLDAISAAWPLELLTHVTRLLKKNSDYVSYPVAVGIASAVHMVSLSDALSAYLNSFSMNLVSAGVRLIPIGQTEGLQIMAGLTECIIAIQEIILRSSLKDLAATSLIVDWTSACHETQHTRLFRS